MEVWFTRKFNCSKRSHFVGAIFALPYFLAVIGKFFEYFIQFVVNVYIFHSKLFQFISVESNFPWKTELASDAWDHFVVNWISSKTFTASGNDWVEEPLLPEIFIKFYIHLKVHCTLLQILILLRIDVHIQCMPSIVFGWPIAVTTPSIV